MVNIIMSTEKLPKVYLYWTNNVIIIEVDPIKGTNSRFNKPNKIQYIEDIDDESYCEVMDGKIIITSKK